MEAESISPQHLGFLTVLGGGIAPYEDLNIVNETRRSVICSAVIEGRVATEGTIAQPGQVMIHPANRPFSEISRHQGVHEWIAFRFETFHPIWSTLNVGSVATLSDVAGTSEAFRSLIWTLRSGSLTQKSELLFRYLGCVEPSVPLESYGRSNRFDPVLQYIDCNLHADVSRSKLADLAGMHPNAFDRAFRIETGLSSQEYVRMVRISRARKKVSDPQLTFDSIAFSLGLSSGAYFSRWFKAETGTSPSDYRDCVKKTSTGYFKSYDVE